MGGIADVFFLGGGNVNIYDIYIYIHGNKHMTNHQIDTRRRIGLQGAKCVGSVMTSFQKACGGALMQGKSVSGELLGLKTFTLQEINISHLGKRKIIFKMPFLGDMLVPWRVGSSRFLSRRTMGFAKHMYGYLTILKYVYIYIYIHM